LVIYPESYQDAQPAKHKKIKYEVLKRLAVKQNGGIGTV
jgi:hypothetical protein